MPRGKLGSKASDGSNEKRHNTSNKVTPLGLNSFARLNAVADVAFTRDRCDRFRASR